MFSTREWLTFLPTNTTSRKWRATPLRHDTTLTKSRSDVSRPTDAFRNILCQVAQPCVSPSFISLRTYLMVPDALTQSRSDVSRPTDAFATSAWGGRCVFANWNIVDAKLLNRFRFTIQAHMTCFSCCLRINKTRGFASPYKHIRDDLQLHT
jgi:hypothetical protein